MDTILQNISYIGLFLDITGAAIIWKFGVVAYLDDPKLHAAIDASIWDHTYDEHLVKYGKVIKITKKWSHVGLFLLLFGFILQMVGNYQNSMTICHLKKELYNTNEKLNTLESNMNVR